MTTELTAQARELLDTNAYVVLATVNADGSPQTSIVWATREGDDLLISTVESRKKARNMRREPRVSVLVPDAGNPATYVEVRGPVTLTREGGPELIQQLSRNYTGNAYTADEGTDNVRVVVRLTPDHLVTWG